MENRRWLRRALLATILMIAAVPALHASAGWSYWTYGDGTDVPIGSSWAAGTYYTQRVTTYSPGGIWFQKYDGPAMEGRWWNCGIYSGGPGPDPDVSNSDPAPGVFLRANGSSYPLYFCLQFRNRSGGSDTFTGALNWDG